MEDVRTDLHRLWAEGRNMSNNLEHFREKGSRRKFFAALAAFAPLSVFDMFVAFLFILLLRKKKLLM